MKISLITTLPTFIENKRLREEAEKMGYVFEVIDLDKMVFRIENGKLKVHGLQDFKTDLVILRGILSSIKVIVTLAENWRHRGIKVFDNHLLEHQYSISKVTDMVKLSLSDLPVPATAHVRSFELYPKLAAKLGYPLVVKSTRTGKGIGVYKMDEEKELLAFIDQCQENGRAPKDFLLQEFIPYVYDLRVLVIGQKVLTMRRIPAEEEFRANFSLGGRVETHDLSEKHRKLALKALASVGLTIGGVDLLLTKENKPYFLEVNHVAGFVGMEKATGENIARIWLKEAIEKAK